MHGVFTSYMVFKQVMLSLMKLGGRAGRAMLKARPWRKVLSDIDDTLKCSGGHFPAGVDKSLPRKAIYPGVLALYRELDLGATDAEEWGPSPSSWGGNHHDAATGSGGALMNASSSSGGYSGGSSSSGSYGGGSGRSNSSSGNRSGGLAALSAWGNGSGSGSAGSGGSGSSGYGGDSNWSSSSSSSSGGNLGGSSRSLRAKEELSFLRRDVGNLVFLSARPHVYQDWSERGQYQHFADANAAQRMHTIPTLLPGDLASGAEYMLSTVKKGDFLPLAKKKVCVCSWVCVSLSCAASFCFFFS